MSFLKIGNLVYFGYNWFEINFVLHKKYKGNKSNSEIFELEGHFKSNV